MFIECMRAGHVQEPMLVTAWAYDGVTPAWLSVCFLVEFYLVGGLCFVICWSSVVMGMAVYLFPKCYLIPPFCVLFPRANLTHTIIYCKVFL
uniref:Uncharacterized protein n=1 Tax=archaeon enrichment culture clone 1(2010) TaxID=795325 RepID=D9CGC7_9ARCH|nr:hypothetical protein pHA1_gp03 [archaeon enrichment culture clone 1(2010)]